MPRPPRQTTSPNTGQSLKPLGKEYTLAPDGDFPTNTTGQMRSLPADQIFLSAACNEDPAHNKNNQSPPTRLSLRV